MSDEEIIGSRLLDPEINIHDINRDAEDVKETSKSLRDDVIGPSNDDQICTKTQDGSKRSDPKLYSAAGNKRQKVNKLRFTSNADKSSQDPKVVKQQRLIQAHEPSSELEISLYDEIRRKDVQIDRLTSEILKLKQFVSKRKQVYKRKRKEEGAPTRALSAYNIFVQDMFVLLAKENEDALNSVDSDAKLVRVPPARLVASTGNKWKELPPEEKARYAERAKADRKRYDEQMAKYQPPGKPITRKRNKTGYNMFFSHHVTNLKSNDTGLPAERGSVARLVGNAWKELSSEEKQHFEREADKQNGMNSDGEEDVLMPEEEKRGDEDYSPGPPVMPIDPNLHRQMMPPHAPVVHQPPHHIPYPPPYLPYPPPPPGYYDYPHPPPHHYPPPPPQGPLPGDDPEDHSSIQSSQHPSHPSQHPPHPGQQSHYHGPPPPHLHHYHPPPHYAAHMEER